MPGSVWHRVPSQPNGSLILMASGPIHDGNHWVEKPITGALWRPNKAFDFGERTARPLNGAPYTANAQIRVPPAFNRLNLIYIYNLTRYEKIIIINNNNNINNNNLLVLGGHVTRGGKLTTSLQTSWSHDWPPNTDRPLPLVIIRVHHTNKIPPAPP